MKMHTIRMSCIAVVLLSPVGFTMRGANGLPQIEQGHISGLMAKITLPDGATRTVKIEGVGCSASICSRTTMKGRTEQGLMTSTWLDSMATILDTTGGNARVVMRDGGQRRISLLSDFRVLYLTNEAGISERLDLSKVKSVEFLGVGHPTTEGAR